MLQDVQQKMQRLLWTVLANNWISVHVTIFFFLSVIILGCSVVNTKQSTWWIRLDMRAASFYLYGLPMSSWLSCHPSIHLKLLNPKMEMWPCLYFWPCLNQAGQRGPWVIQAITKITCIRNHQTLDREDIGFHLLLQHSAMNWKRERGRKKGEWENDAGRKRRRQLGGGGGCRSQGRIDHGSTYIRPCEDGVRLRERSEFTASPLL